MKIKKQNRAEHANDVMLSFTLSNIGLIETYKENKAQLMKVIQVEKD